jgi:hypothetical protein
MNEPEKTFTITLADLRALADAMCAVDSLKAYADRDMKETLAQVKAGHDAVIRTLGPHVELVYAIDDGPEQAAA